MNKTKGWKQIKPPLRFDEEFGYYWYVKITSAMIPERFDEAITWKDSNERKTAMNHEMDSLVKNIRGHLYLTRPPKKKD